MKTMLISKSESLSLRKQEEIIIFLWFFTYFFVPLQPKSWFRSSVGLEQQPSKLWVLGSNPNGITQF